jgi:HlyD family secretion protein
MAEPGPAAGAGLHRAVIEISQAALQALPAGAGLIPGMTVTAEIATGTRSVISYVLQPLIKGARESLREP